MKSQFIEMFGDVIQNTMGWSAEPLNDICENIVDCPHSTQKYLTENTGYACIRTSIVKRNHIEWENIEYISEDEYHKRISRRKPQQGDIVYTREGAILGIAAIIDQDCPVALGQRSMMLTPDSNKCVPEFLCYAMNSESFFNEATKGLAGSASPHINVGDIKKLKCILPPLHTQKKFSEIVQQADKSKFEINQSLEKLETLKKALMQDYFE